MSEQPARVVEPEDRLGMTEEQWQRFQTYTHGFGEQDEHGVDVSLLRGNLRLTPKQRMAKLFPALELDRRCRMTDPQQSFQSLLAAVSEGGVRCVLIGGVAMIAHGSDYSTRDIDLCYARDAQNLAALAQALAPLHPRLRGVPGDLPFRWDAQTLRSGMNFTLVTDTADVDLLGDVAGIESFEVLWERSNEMEILGVSVRVASIDDLIAMKRAAGRTKDRLHLLELERLRALLAEDQLPSEGPG